MASSPSALLKLELPADGDYRGLWGPPMRQIINQIEAAIAGVTSISTTGGTKTLTDTQYAASEARVSYFYVSGTLSSDFTIIAPQRDKSYVVQNATTGAYGVYIKSGASGAAILIPQGSSAAVRTHASNVTTYEAVPVTSSSGAVWSEGIPDGSILTAKLESALQTSITNAIDGAAKTGDMKCKFTDTLDSGWLYADGKTIGSASSGGTARAHADTQALYEALWNTYSNTILPIQTSGGSATSRGASGAADFAANKRMPLPNVSGRVFAALDNLGGSPSNVITASAADTVGGTLGNESANIAAAELPNRTCSYSSTTSSDSHYHYVARYINLDEGDNPSSSNYLATGDDPFGGPSSPYNYMLAGQNSSPNVFRTSSDSHSHTVSGNTSSINGGVTQTALSRVQPTFFGYVLIKL